MKGRESNWEDRKREVIICLWDRKKSGIMNLSGSQKTFISAAKYEQTVNMPIFTFKKPFFRIFWKILAKTGPQTLYLCGFPEASVEMRVAPFRALTHISKTCSIFSIVEMRVAPFRALTLISRPFNFDFRSVEMRVAPFRALTH